MGRDEMHECRKLGHESRDCWASKDTGKRSSKGQQGQQGQSTAKVVKAKGQFKGKTWGFSEMDEWSGGQARPSQVVVVVSQRLK